MAASEFFLNQSFPFREPLMTTRGRREIFLRCQAEWDQRVARAAGIGGRVTHLTNVESGEAREFVFFQGTSVPYPDDLAEALRNAREWSRKRSQRPPALEFAAHP